MAQTIELPSSHSGKRKDQPSPDIPNYLTVLDGGPDDQLHSYFDPAAVLTPASKYFASIYMLALEYLSEMLENTPERILQLIPRETIRDLSSSDVSSLARALQNYRFPTLEKALTVICDFATVIGKYTDAHLLYAGPSEDGVGFYIRASKQSDEIPETGTIIVTRQLLDNVNALCEVYEHPQKAIIQCFKAEILRSFDPKDSTTFIPILHEQGFITDLNRAIVLSRRLEKLKRKHRSRIFFYVGKCRHTPKYYIGTTTAPSRLSKTKDVIYRPDIDADKIVEFTDIIEGGNPS